HTRFSRDWSSDVCSSDLVDVAVVFKRVQQTTHFFIDNPVLAKLHFGEVDAEARCYFQAEFTGAPKVVGMLCTGHISFRGRAPVEIGRASCRERVWRTEGR